MAAIRELPEWKNIQKEKEKVEKMILDDLGGNINAPWLVACAMIKPSTLAVIYAGSAIAELGDTEWKNLL